MEQPCYSVFRFRDTLKFYINKEFTRNTEKVMKLVIKYDGLFIVINCIQINKCLMICAIHFQDYIK